MESPAALDASPELIWLFGVVVLGVVIALMMLYAQRPGARQRHDNATKRNYARHNADE